MAEHASKPERQEIFKRHRLSLLAIGVVTGLLGAAPGIVWASGVVFAAAFLVLVPVAIWIYTLVFAFSSLWFTHYCLAALQRLRERGANGAGACRPSQPNPHCHQRPACTCRPRPPTCPPMTPTFGLIIVGDEILSGKRADKHLAKVIELLAARGLALGYADYVGDDRPRITAALQRAFASSDMVFQLRRHRRHARRPHAPVRGGGAWPVPGAAPRGCGADPRAHAGRGARAGPAV